VDADRADELTAAWVDRHRPEDAPSPAAREGIRRLLEDRVPDPAAAAAIVDVEGRRQVAALAGGALYLLWAVPGSSSVPEAARCRRIPLERASVELSERVEGAKAVRHWWFELPDEPLVLRVHDARDGALAEALAAALGWPSLG